MGKATDFLHLPYKLLTSGSQKKAHINGPNIHQEE
jgi:hypothetical protein